MNITYTQNGDYLIPNIIIRKTKPLGHYGAIGVQSGQSPKNNEKRRTAGISPRKPGGRLLRLLYAYE